MDNFLIKFIVDAVARFASKTPWFFKVLQGLSAVAYLVAGLPAHLAYLCKNQMLCIELTGTWASLQSQAVGIASIVIVIVSQFAVTTPEVKIKKIKE